MGELDINTIVSRLMEFLAAGLISSFGGVAAYLYTNSKGTKKFAVGTFAISIFLAFFIGNLVGSFIPVDFKYRDGILLLAGYSTFPILSLLESKGKHIIVNFIENRLGANVPKEQHFTPMSDENNTISYNDVDNGIK